MATFHINRSGTSLGTFSEDEVREGLRSGKFVGTDLGWREGMATWEPLAQISEFAQESGSGGTPSPRPQFTGAGAITPTATTAPRSGLPWDDRQLRGMLRAFFDTLVMVLTKPAEAFTAMKREGGFGEPLLYAIIGGSVGGVIYFLYNFLLGSAHMLGSHENPMMQMMGGGIRPLFFIILVPLFVTIATFVGSGIFHLCLMIVGGAKQPFETTFRVVCFAGGSANPLLVIPICGGLIGGIWKIVLYCIGFARAHETDTGRAVLAVALPLILCCGGIFALMMMLGLGAFGFPHH
ncbi:MAG: hypothetical protein DME43_07560 [Verrucomicrobia bacterium]|nr:MAG: hypothetical protein DME43_07560 [Verrucomicrobiota bacterium]